MRVCDYIDLSVCLTIQVESYASRECVSNCNKPLFLCLGLRLLSSRRKEERADPKFPVSCAGLFSKEQWQRLRGDSLLHCCRQVCERFVADTTKGPFAYVRA